MKIEFDSENITLEELDAVVSFLNALRKGRFVSDESSQSVDSLKELDEKSVLKVVYDMHSYALTRNHGDLLKTLELYRFAMKRTWNDISPNSRKAIGRQFKKVVDEHYTQTPDGELVVAFKERNVQNTAIYEVKLKDSKDDEL